MLFLLTGDFQIGKTRWLEALVGKLAGEGVESYGVIAPGIWVPSDSPKANAQGLEKLGIDNLLLPEGERFPFAKRRDLAIRDGVFQKDSQSEQLVLGWHIFDDAIDKVNAHFDALACAVAEREGAEGAVTLAEREGAEGAEVVGSHACIAGSDSAASRKPSPVVLPQSPSFLVVDELGRLELMQSTGLTSAVALLDEGPTPQFPHAIAVVRETLLQLAEERFAAAWPEMKAIGPTREAEEKVLAAFGLS